jgi:hypothetical protein
VAPFSGYAVAMGTSPIPAFLRALDALDLEAVIALFADDAVLSMPFGEEVDGEGQLRPALESFLGELRATEHNVSAEWNPEPDVWIAEMTATYELHDFSRRGPYRRVVIARTSSQKITQLALYGAHELPLPEDPHPANRIRGPHGWLPTL